MRLGLTGLDWIALAFVAVIAVGGFARGFVGSALSLVGTAAGAVVGARLAPLFLHQGTSSPYAPLAALAGALLGAMLLSSLTARLGTVVGVPLRFPPLRLLDSTGGFLLGAVTGLALVWVVGATALFLPGHPTWRQDIQQSEVLRRLDQVVAPDQLLNILARIDPYAAIAGPLLPDQPPTSSVLRNPLVRAAAPSIVRVLGSACGVGIEGSGWVAGPGLVVTAAHVVAGETDTVVEQSDSNLPLTASVVVFDPRNDVAILRVPELDAHPLPLAPPHPNEPAAIVGYPENGPLDSTPARVGQTQTLRANDAYGHGPVTRTVTALAGEIRPGNSGGPTIDARGHVEATVFASSTDSTGGYATPSTIVATDLTHAHTPVSTQTCAA
jgi:S1-C subfamily serine protease